MASDEAASQIANRYLTTICAEVDAGRVTPEASMAERGAPSLDVVEVVSCSVRELEVRGPS